MPVQPPTLYTTTWCGYCRILKRGLDEKGFVYVEVDVESTPGAAERVEQVNGGNRTVPTVVFDDGATMTNPPAGDVIAKQQALSAG